MTGMRSGSRAGVPVFHRAGVPVFRRAGVPVLRRAGVPVGRRVPSAEPSCLSRGRRLRGSDSVLGEDISCHDSLQPRFSEGRTRSV